MKNKLYNEEDLEIMARTRDSVNKSRIQELISYAKVSKYKTIGIANCITMQKYATKFKSILEENGFCVFNINCKESGLQNSDLFGEDAKGASCDPAFQAKYLNEANTDLNINMGLCLGHGIIFEKHSNAPVTTLLVKDFSTGHKTIEELK